MHATEPKAKSQIGLFRSPDIFRDMVGGSVAAIVSIAYCISFSALIFKGDLAHGLSLGLTALLIGTAVTGAVVATFSALVPADGGPDNPAIAVMSVLAVAVSSSLVALQAPADTIIIHVLLALSVSTFFSGLVLFLLGICKAGQWLRFIPYPVIGGFLAASGWFLLLGGFEVMSGGQITDASWPALFTPEHIAPILVGFGFACALYILRKTFSNYFILPGLFLLSLLLIHLVTYFAGSSLSGDGFFKAWFLSDIGEAKLWQPLLAVASEEINWAAILRNSVEIGAVAGVTAISLLLDVSSLEVARGRATELDDELKWNGVANLGASVLGGFAGNLSLNGSILIKEAGGISRLSGIFAALICALVLLYGPSIAALIPTPLLGGLLAYVGFFILEQAIFQAPARRSWADMIFTAIIMLIIINFGYLMGVVFGIVGACLIFALSYSRINIVKRHLTRRDFSSNMDRSVAQSQLLRKEGEKIHIIWLNGFLFFGSSNRLFEYIRKTIENRDRSELSQAQLRYAVLDFSAVPGLDISAVLSLVKLRNFCDEKGVVLVFSGVSAKTKNLLDNIHFFSEQRPHQLVDARPQALEWCENALLQEFNIAGFSEEQFELWLGSQIEQDDRDITKIMTYLERREIEPGEELYREGEPSDSIDFIASGLMAVTLQADDGTRTYLRRMAGQNVVGEMGFYRSMPRSATILAEEPSVIYRLSAQAFAKMQKEDPDVAAAFDKFIIRSLSDRLAFANREISALV